MHTLPDYKIAANKLNELFASLKLAVTISPPFGEVKEDWPCISFHVQIGRETFNYSLGIGHVDWKKARKAAFESFSFIYNGEDKLFLNVLASGGTPKDKQYTAALAAKVAKIQDVKPNPAEVLGCVCRDGLDVEQNSFEDWCSNLAYDTDSRKVLATFNACRDNGSKARRIVSGRVFEELAELSSQL